MIRLSGDLQIFQDILSAILVMQNEVKFFLTPEVLRASVVSLDHTAAVFITAPKELFTKFEVPANVEFGVKADELKKRLAHLDGEITLEIESEVTILSSDTKYTVPLFDVKAFDKQPKIMFDAKTTLSYVDFKKSIDKVAVVSETLGILMADGKVVFTGKGELPSDKVEVKPSTAVSEGTAKSAFQMSYASSMAKAVAPETVVIELREAGEMRLTLGNVVYLVGGRQTQ